MFGRHWAISIRQKNSDVNFRKFSWASGTEFSDVEHDKPHSFVCLKFSNNFEEQTEH